MKEYDQVVFLVDVDNTLLDNDQVEADLPQKPLSGATAPCDNRSREGHQAF
jgi:hypothetical protein